MSALNGVLQVTGDLGACIIAYGIGATGRIEVGGNLWGTLETVFSGVEGQVVVHGDLTALVVVGSLAQANLTGAITVDHDLTGRIDVSVNLVDDTDNPAAGHIIVNGSFGNGFGPGYINIAGRFGWSQAFIAVDYDGDQSQDEWKQYAFIDVAWRRLTGNAPEEHVWEISPCKGDLDGSWSVDFADINPFVLALSNPVGYSQTFPGLGCTDDPNDPNCLGGSRIWHGDVNCDGSLDFGDINPFVVLMEHQCCMLWDCAPCWDGDAGERMSPQQLAAQLATHIWPELYDDLVGVVGAAIEVQPDDESRAYWEAVYAALTE